MQSLVQTLFHAVAVTYSGQSLGKAWLILGNVHSLRQMAHRRILGPGRARAIARLREFIAPWDQRWGSLIAIPLFLKEYPVSTLEQFRGRRAGFIFCHSHPDAHAVGSARR